MKKLKVLLAVSIALNLAAAAVLANPMAMEAEATAKGCLSVGHATSLNAIMKAASCSEFESKLGLAPGACQGNDVVEAGFWMVDGTDCPSGRRYQVKAAFPGDWQPN